MPKMNPEGIYVNKNLRLDNIQVYGFDYDYALAHYSANFQSLIYDLVKDHIVNEMSLGTNDLVYFWLKECLLELDFFGSIEPDGCFFGRRKPKGNREMYGTRHIGRGQARGLVGLRFVQHFVDAKLQFDASYLYEDLNHAIQHVQRSGLVHRGQMLLFLKMLKEKGKKLFLMNNSPYYFVDGGMRDSWRDVFDVVIAQVNKPEFYTSEHPFRYYDPAKDTLAFSKVMYFGDHLFSDLRGPLTERESPETHFFLPSIIGLGAGEVGHPLSLGFFCGIQINELQRDYTPLLLPCRCPEGGIPIFLPNLKASLDPSPIKWPC
ncbi:hypothetical protein C5167_050167 [Papaver somniferum]|uniref:Uncharacterized protein n=1 Tax=Papaver somniferum TaxID=3469 RepID=A0A4Y7KPC1_PAPSO|nr:hypothetical protein C5167_050167 [Papaver somniferum]